MMDRIAIVTGGSRGIGAATARKLGSLGYAVAVNYVREEAGASAVARDIEATGGKAIVVQGDMAVEADILRLFGETDARLGPMTALVNNAGTLNRAGRLVDMTADGIARVLAVNTVGSILCAREAVRRMSTARGGK